MNSVCAWCSAEIGNLEPEGSLGLQLSHGICGSCRDKFFSNNGIAFQQFLDSLSIPILVIDRNFEILTANRKACEALGTTPTQVHGSLPGEVFDCPYARLPEGCGKAIHCSACAIRKAVIHSFETGERQSMIPATLKFDDGDNDSAVAFIITTAKTGNVVLLHLEHI